MFSLNNKHTVITGGGSGIGKAIALLFATKGSFVHIIELNQDAANEVMNEIVSKNGKAKAYGCNVSSQEAVKQVIQKIGKVDILVNNAGIAHVGNIEHTSTQDFERLINVNVKGVYNCLREVIPVMKNAGGGVILNMCSVAALVGISDRFAYSMSKGAVYAMSMSVAKDYLNYNIRCNSISPARVHTPFVDGFIAKNFEGMESETFERLAKSQPIGRMGTPDEIAATALFLCSDEAGFITGNDYAVDGGFVKLNN